MTFWHKLLNMDRRIMWSAIFVIVGVILLRPIGLPIEVGPSTQSFYDYVANAPQGSIIWVESGFSSGSLPEQGPQLRAFLIQAFRRDFRIVMSSLGVDGAQLGQDIFEEVRDTYFPDLEYGVDFVNVGYRPGALVYATALGDDVMAATGGVDVFGRNLADLPLVQQVPRLHGDYVEFMAHFWGHEPGPDHWYGAVGHPNRLPMIVGAAQMVVPQVIPFLEAEIIQANIPGMRGAAEYEILVGELGAATAGQDVTSAMVIFMTVLVILGNVAFIITTKQAERR